MDISYDYYKAFYYVAKNLSFTRAAEQLFAEQPNVTRTIKMLEERLGCVLFNRSKRRVALTPEGENLYRHLQIAFEHIRLAEEEITRGKSLRGGTVTIGASETALYGLLLSVLKDFRERYSEVGFKVGNYSSKQAIAALKDGLVDFAVVTTPLDAGEALTVYELKRFREIAVCGNAFSELAEKEVSLETLLRYPVVGLGRSTKTYDFYAERFAERGLPYKADIEVATADQLMPMIACNLGWGFVPEFFVTDDCNVRQINVAERIPKRSICLVLKEKPIGIAAKTLIEELLARREID